MASSNSSKKMKIKINIVMGVLIVIGFGILACRLYTLQIVEGDFYRSKALSQQLRPTSIPAQRGDIYDRNMKKLATSATVWNVILSPGDIKDDEQLELIANFLAPLLEIDKEKIIERGKKKNSYHEILKQRVNEDVASQVTAFCLENELNCIYMPENSKRFYPYDRLASTILGFTDSGNNGAYGLESYYNKILSGTPGIVVSAKNALSENMPYAYDKMFEPVNGNSVVLTIDEVIQHSLEKHLETAVREHNVKNRAVGIAMDVNTGAILAMSSKPDFNPNEPSVLLNPDAILRMEQWDTSEEAEAIKSSDLSDDEKKTKLTEAKQAALQKEWYAQWRNKAISDPYEPGSVFKLVTASMALDLGVDTEHGRTYNCPGYHIVAGRKKGCWKLAGHGAIDFTGAVKYSCNPAFMMIGAAVGAENFFNYFDRFGLREASGIDLPGETEGIFYNLATLSKESGEELASSSFGQTFKITPLQMITAVSAVVNGGKLMQPYIVSEVIDPDGNVVSKTDPIVRRQVISQETSYTMRRIMEKVVGEPDGSGKLAYVPGYRVGGKTGTSEKLDAKDDGEVTKRISSFMGMAPSNDPQIAVLIILDEPTMGNIYGSVIAAPVVGAIMADILPYLEVEPQYTPAELIRTEVSVPSTVGQFVHDGIMSVTSKGLKYKLIGEGTRVIRQLPSPGQVMPVGGTVILYTEESDTIDQTEVPDVTGLSVQQANRTILNSKLNVKLDGQTDGGSITVLWQDPPAGSTVSLGTIVTIGFTEKTDKKTAQ